MPIETDLLMEVLDLVKDDFTTLGLAAQFDLLDSCVGSGEWEVAYTDLCSLIQEFEVPLSQEAYELMVKAWPLLRVEIRNLEGPDWHFVDYLGDRGGIPIESQPGVKPPVEAEQPAEPPETRGKRVYPWNAEPTGVQKPGSLELHASWTLSGPTLAAFNRLVELGVHIFPNQRGDCYTFEVPHGLFPEQEAEIQRLMEAAAREARSEVSYIDWYPHGIKYRIYLPDLTAKA